MGIALGVIETLRRRVQFRIIAMFKIEAIIQPFKSSDVREALKGIGIDGIIVIEERGEMAL